MVHDSVYFVCIYISSCQATTLRDNCVSFGMPAPRLEGVDAIEEDMTATESSWALYKEYSSELKVWLDTHAHIETCAECEGEGERVTQRAGGRGREARRQTFRLTSTDWFGEESTLEKHFLSLPY